MSGYIRTTRGCSASQLHPKLLQAIREYFQVHQLGDPEAGTSMCCETISRKKERGKLAAFLEGDPDTTVHLALLLTPDWLIWACNGDQSGTIVTGGRIKVPQVKAFVLKRTKNMQLEVSGFINDSKEFVRGKLEMGPSLAAQKFCEEVGQAILKVNPPAKKSFPGWMGG